MPLLSFDTTLDLSAEDRRRFGDVVRELYADVMQTSTGHVAVLVRTQSPGSLSIGRETGDGPLLFLDADVRRGRSQETKRAFALGVMDLAHETFGVPESNMKVVFTQHDGPEMMGYDRVGSDWRADDGDGT